MRKTTNYNLSQYDATDRVTRAAFNADNAAVDMALKAIATAAANAGSAASAAQTTANSASSAAATAQSTANTAKSNAATAQSTANTAKTNAATAQSAAESAQATADSALALAQAAGNCRIEHGTYTGDHQSTRTLTFSGTPSVVLIGATVPNGLGGSALWAVRGAQHAVVPFYDRSWTEWSMPYLVRCNWSENTLTFYTDLGIGRPAVNEKGETYCYVALCAAD